VVVSLGMDDDALQRRLAGVETALAHLTEAVEEMAELVPEGPSARLIASHLKDAKDAFNRLLPRVGSPA
jgi:hypothetical protein